MSVQQTLGLLPRLCTGTGTRLRHQPKSEYERPRTTKNQQADQEDRNRARETRYHQEKGLPCRADELGRGGSTPKRRRQDVPTRLAGTHEGKTTSPNHSSMTHIVNQCGVKPQSDLVAAIRHMAAFIYGRSPRTTPIQRRVKRASVELAK